MLLGPSSCRIGMRNSSNMSGYTMPVAVYSAKKKYLNIFCLNNAQSTFNFGLFLACSVPSGGLLFPQILKLCWLTFPDKWKVVSSMKTNLEVRHLQFFKESYSKICSELHCHGQLHVAVVDTYHFKISGFSTECYAVCLSSSKHGWLAGTLNESPWTSSTWASVTGQPAWLFLLNGTSVIKQFIPLINQQFYR
jgi:hypothetical protein